MIIKLNGINNIILRCLLPPKWTITVREIAPSGIIVLRRYNYKIWDHCYTHHRAYLLFIPFISFTTLFRLSQCNYLTYWLQEISVLFLRNFNGYTRPQSKLIKRNISDHAGLSLHSIWNGSRGCLYLRISCSHRRRVCLPLTQLLTLRCSLKHVAMV